VRTLGTWWSAQRTSGLTLQSSSGSFGSDTLPQTSGVAVRTAIGDSALTDRPSVPSSRGLLNIHPQKTFAPLKKFGVRGINTHTHAGGKADTIVVFVHGFHGHGYKTWRGLPGAVFHCDQADKCDVAVYHYKTGVGAISHRGADLNFHIEQFAGILRDMSGEYKQIFVVAHSLGGLVSSSAIRSFLQDSDADLSSTALSPVAALILFASPRAGSRLARPFLSPLIREFKWLRIFSPYALEIEKFFESKVEGVAIADPGRRRYIIPRYACIGSEDRVVDIFSATFGIPKQQILPLNGDHSSIVKPVEGDPTQLYWLARIISDVKSVRLQYLRDYRQRSMPPPDRPSIKVDSPAVIAELWTDTDATSFEWKQLYDEVRSEAAVPGVEVLDRRRGFDSSEVDILISLHAVEAITSSHSVENQVRVQKVRERHSGSSRLQVGIAVVGENYPDAELAIRSWVEPTEPSSSLYVRSASNSDELREILYRWIRPLVDIHSSHLRAVRPTYDSRPHEIYTHSEED
jgi:pimeloyl-ACP methyl ester carboxylesterase